jgi:uncharacterized membrane protein
MSSKYQLDFISDEAIFEHVKRTVLKYRFNIDLADFSHNLVDPIKLTFDAKVYKRKIESVIEDEVFRQIDKSNTNHIGYFHQNIFNLLGSGWYCPEEGYDIVNDELHIYVEMKNKHNTMNSSSSQKTYMRMQNTLLADAQATCFLVEVIAQASQDRVWRVAVDKQPMENERIRRISIDKFYKIVTDDALAFKKLCQALPTIIEDVVQSLKKSKASNTVTQELKAIDENLLKSVYLLSFARYEGFDDFTV